MRGDYGRCGVGVGVVAVAAPVGPEGACPAGGWGAGAWTGEVGYHGQGRAKLAIRRFTRSPGLLQSEYGPRGISRDLLTWFAKHFGFPAPSYSRLGMTRQLLLGLLRFGLGCPFQARPNG